MSGSNRPWKPRDLVDECEDHIAKAVGSGAECRHPAPGDRRHLDAVRLPGRPADRLEQGPPH